MAKKKRKKKDKKLNKWTGEAPVNGDDTWDGDSAMPLDGVEIRLYSDMDIQTASLVQELKNRMAKAASDKLDLRTFIHECTQIGATAFVLGTAVDACTQKLQRLGMNQVQCAGAENVANEQTEAGVPRPDCRPEQ